MACMPKRGAFLLGHTVPRPAEPSLMALWAWLEPVAEVGGRMQASVQAGQLSPESQRETGTQDRGPAR